MGLNIEWGCLLDRGLVERDALNRTFTIFENPKLI